jgi:peptidoglycan/LPS O-acetylase OafA/YrhL
LQAAVAAKRLSGLDHLRALAIIIVLAYHYSLFGHPPGLYDYLGSWGWTGVDLFFVLSGYLIGGQLFAKIAKDQPVSYGEFYFKRSLRILPAYFAVLILYLTIPAFTLCIEEQFYLILPLLIIALGTRKKTTWILPILFLLGFAIRSFMWFDVLPKQPSFGKAYYEFIYYPTWSRLDGLLAGVVLSAFYYFQPAAWQRLTRHGNRLLLIALALVAGAWFIAHDDHQYEMRGAIFGYPAISIAYGALVLVALSPTSLLYRYSSGLTRWIATLSYSIYLTHKQLIHLTHEALHQFNIENDTWLSFWISTAVALLGGWLLHLLVEKPFLRLRDKWLARKKAPPLPVPSPQS